jgi:hypothetical protein
MGHKLAMPLLFTQSSHNDIFTQDHWRRMGSADLLLSSHSDIPRPVGQ